MNRYLLITLGVSAWMLGGATTARAAEAEPVPSYARHVTAVFSRLGCNGGTCHGAVKGQNGFKLSLFAGDPGLDHARLLREDGGRRLNFVDPDASLLLMKATSQIGHQGGKRMAAGSPEYKLLSRWIAAGAPMDSLEKGRVSELKVTPASHTLKPGESYRLKVEAKYVDGSTEDVTAICSYDTLDPMVATVEPSGKVEASGVGDAALVIRYGVEPTVAMVLVPRPAAEAFPDLQPNNFVDNHILAKLRRLNIPPSGMADDATFLRRVTLDVTGELPTAQEVRAFLADKAADKRAKKIDELLKKPGHAALWTLKFCDLLKASDFGVYADGMRVEADAPRMQAWIRARMDENLPYDQLVERILTATSRDSRPVETWAREVMSLTEGYAPGRKDCEEYSKRQTLDLYWQRGTANGVSGSLQVAHAFLGIRLECAQCHRHPHDVWQQDDLLSFANFFMRVRKPGFQGDNEKKFPEVAAMTKQLTEEAKKLADQAKHIRDFHIKKMEADLKAAKDADLQKQLDQLKAEVVDMEKKSKLVDEVTRRMMHAEIRLLPDAGPATVTSPIGTQTSKNFRLLGENDNLAVGKDEDPRLKVVEWLRRKDNPYFARAMVNPPPIPELPKELADGFIANKFDLRWLHRAILNSRTYQQSSMATPANETDRANYAYFYFRRLPAEVLVDALNHATGTSEKMDMQYQHWPAEIKTVEIPFTPKNAFVVFMLENFGKPKRNSAVQCDCERDGNASVLQVLSFANHPRVWEKIVADTGRVAKIAKEVGETDKQIEEIFLVSLGRMPNDAERQACLKYMKESDSPVKGLQGVLWSLVNTREFLLQH